MNASNVKEFWSNLSFAMSFSSLLLFPNDISSTSYEEGLLTVITKGNRRIEIQTEVIDFDKETNLLGVHDFFDIKFIYPHSESRIKDKDRFVKQVDFYRYSGTTRGLIATSNLTYDELLDPDHGQGIAMIKTLRMMKNEGIVGPFSREYNGKRYHKKPVIQFHKRISTPLFKSLYSFDEVYKMEQQKGEAWKMIEKIRVR